MKRHDIKISLIIGILTGLVWAPVLAQIFQTTHTIVLTIIGIVITPILFLLGLYLGTWLSRWKSFFYSFAKYAMIGFLNTGIDFIIFDFLIFVSGIDRGAPIALFKTIGFCAGLVNSYFWNKHWAFEQHESPHTAREFISFAAVTTIGIGLNVGITTLIANGIHPPFGLRQFAWDNAAAALATISNLVWNFLGYHLIVFKTKKY